MMKQFKVKMAKLSKLLLKAFFCASANAQDEPIFQVTSCNIDVSIRPGETRKFITV